MSADDLSSAFSDATSDIPGFGIVQQFLLQNFGVEANELVSKYLIVFAVYKFLVWFYEKAYDFLENHFTSAIEVDDYDDLWQQLIDWARTQPMTKISREIKAVTLTASTFRDPDDEDAALIADLEEDDDDVFGPTGLFSFDAWNRKNPLIYKPNVKMTFFKHNGRYFQWSTGTRRNVYGNGEDQLIIIRCLGRDTKPIKQFLEYVKGWTHEKQVVKPTHVYRTSTRNNGGDGGQWTRVAVRPSRPLSTVALDDVQKGMIVRDINEYLHPATARWYAARGIPYRRGYLFHGPPGTGKTSLSFSLAGIFGLKIYCVALGEVGMTEATLGNLFADLPERCIVLLEDIDSAGLTRTGGKTEGQDGAQDGTQDDGQDDEGDNSVQQDGDGPTKPQMDGSKNDKGFTGGTGRPGLISLAGLLNVIDGAASQEGRVLIMTTNYPEKLDSALIRPGRVDLQIGFTLATHTQIRDIFKRMYNTALDTNTKGKGKDAVIEGAAAADFTPGDLFASAEEKAFLERFLGKRTLPVIKPNELTDLAEKFASSLPSEVFSPAEIQGFLLKRKTDPIGAVDEAEKWKVGQMEAKKKRKKVVDPV